MELCWMKNMKNIFETFSYTICIALVSHRYFAWYSQWSLRAPLSALVCVCKINLCSSFCLMFAYRRIAVNLLADLSKIFAARQLGHDSLQQRRGGFGSGPPRHARPSHRKIVQRQYARAFLDSQGLPADDAGEGSRSHHLDCIDGWLCRHSEAHRLLFEQVCRRRIRWGSATGVGNARRWWRSHHGDLPVLHPSDGNVRRRQFQVTR